MKEIVTLDGNWQVIFDHDNKGRTLNWQHREDFYSYQDIEQVTVPACLEEFKQDYEGVAWYGKNFNLPSGWQKKHSYSFRGGQLSLRSVGQRRSRWRTRR